MIRGTRVNILHPDKRFRLLVWARGDCWEWRGTKYSMPPWDYGAFWVNSWSGREAAHRYSYTMAKGPIPPELELDHLCRHPWCVRPSHLEAVTGQINVLRGIGPAAKAAKVTHCPRGHEYIPENTRTNDRGYRWCIACYEATKASLRTGKPTTGQRYAARTHCKNGHAFTPENTRRRGNARICIACTRKGGRR